MSLRVLPDILLRAPLLPASRLPAATAALRRSALGAAAVQLASPGLSAALVSRRGSKGSAAATAALSRYARRAAFRPTPSGLLAGVGMATLGSKTRLQTTHPAGHLRPTWERLAALGRALLNDPDIRTFARLRVAPSLLARGAGVVWLAFDESGAATTREVWPDDTLVAVLETTQQWCSWNEVRRACGDDDDESVDEYLLSLTDDGLLHHDLCPPLLGDSPAKWMRARLARLPGGPTLASVQAQFAQVLAACAAGDVASATGALQKLPGARADGASPLHAVLVHGFASAPRLCQKAVQRAADLAPLLFRLQDVLAPPAAERALNKALLEHIEAVTETFGVGALDVGALATGAYGHTLATVDDESPSAAPDPVVVAYLADALVTAARQGRDEVELEPMVLDGLLPRSEPPCTFELVLSPAVQPPRTAPGTGWLLGLHAPAGASAGRFAEALGAPMMRALKRMAVAEGEARPGEETVDVAFAASPRLADLSAHPATRARALAVTSWSDGDSFGPDEIELVADPAAIEPLALRSTEGTPLRPAPLHRVRSTNLPGGIYRLLAGWSFTRQHTPWALSWSVLGDLPRLPRVLLDGFVIAPGSWRIPNAETLGRRGGLAAWRSQHAVPQFVALGEGDELLFVDLSQPTALPELARHEGGRAHEIWPPLDRLVDQGGRRVEAIVSVVEIPDDADRARRQAAINATRRAGVVAPPFQEGPADAWLTFRIFGAVDRQDKILVEAIAPVVQAARTAGDCDAWFFLRYADVRGRDHLRVRLHVARADRTSALTARVLRALAPSRACGDVVAVEIADYFRETARYGGPEAMRAAEQLFERDSDLAIALLTAQMEAAAADEMSLDARDRLVLAFDALTAGLGLSASARQQLAARRRDAFAHAAGGEGESSRDLDADYRGRSRQLMVALSGPPAGANAVVLELTRYGDGLKRLVATWPAATVEAIVTVLPTILHMTAVRLCGASPADEAAAFVFWQRALQGISSRQARDKKRSVPSQSN